MSSLLVLWVCTRPLLAFRVTPKLHEETSRKSASAPAIKYIVLFVSETSTITPWVFSRSAHNVQGVDRFECQKVTLKSDLSSNVTKYLVIHFSIEAAVAYSNQGVNVEPNSVRKRTIKKNIILFARISQL